MLRLKLFGLVALLAVGGPAAVFWLARNEAAPRARAALEEDGAQARNHLRALLHVRNERLVKVATWLAHHPELRFVHAMKQTTEEGRHQDAFSAIESVRPLLQKAKRERYRPAAILVVDENKKVVARDRFRALRGQAIGQPLLGRVLSERVKDWDLWEFRLQNVRLCTAVAVPLVDGPKVLGALVLLYRLDRGLALAQRKLLTLERHFQPEIAYYYGDRLYGSTLNRPQERAALHRYLKEHPAAGNANAPGALRIDKRPFITYRSPLEGGSSRKGGFLLLARSDRETPLGSVAARLPFVVGGLLLVGLILGLWIFRSAVRPFEELEQGALEVLAGNKRYRFSAGLPGAAGNIAQALNLSLRSEDENADDDAGAASFAWDDPLFVEELSTSELQRQELAAHMSDLDSRLGLTLNYYERLFQRFVDAKRETGEEPTGFTFELFVEKVRESEALLRKKYACRVVKFEVALTGGRTILRPIPLK